MQGGLVVCAELTWRERVKPSTMQKRKRVAVTFNIAQLMGPMISEKVRDDDYAVARVVHNE